MPIELFSQRELLRYLCTLSEEERLRLYAHEVACRAVFRALSPTCRVLVFHLLGRTANKWDEHLVLLSKLNIVRYYQGGSGGTRIELHPVFLKGIRDALTREGGEATTAAASSSFSTEVERVEAWAQSQWDDVLHFLVHAEDGGGGGSAPASTKQAAAPVPTAKRVKIAAPELPASIKEALTELGFHDKKRITSSGYEYILKDVFEEVWIFLQYFLSKEQSPSALLALLFSLSFKRPGDRVSLAAQLPAATRSVLVSLGLLHPTSNGDDFLVSSLGVFALLGPSKQRKQQSSSSSSSSSSADGTTEEHHRRKFGLANMRIVVETTFKVYCYTESEMHASMLQLFCQLEARLPNLIVAMITRESVAKAFQKGISAQQILSFLEQNADPITHTLRTKVVPDNVSDQITLWKKETSRLSLLNLGTLVECTNTSRQAEVFRETSAALEDKIVWTDGKSRVFAKEDGGDDVSSSVKDVLRQVKAKLGV